MISAHLSTVFVIIGFLTLALLYADHVAVTWAHPLDQRASRFLVMHRTKWETTLMRAVSWVGGPYGLLLVTLATVLWINVSVSSQLMLRFLIVLLSSVVYVLLMKRITARKRPSFHVLEHERTYSFPSAHSLVSTTLYLMIAVISLHQTAFGSWILGGVLVFIFLVGVSRVYLGTHYLSDVLAGLLGGTVWASIFLLVAYAAYIRF